MFGAFLSLHATVTSSKKPICYEMQKTHFGPIFVKKSQCKVFPEKMSSSTLSLYAAVTSQKIRNVPCIGF